MKTPDDHFSVLVNCNFQIRAVSHQKKKRGGERLKREIRAFEMITQRSLGGKFGREKGPLCTMYMKKSPPQRDIAATFSNKKGKSSRAMQIKMQR